MHQRESFRQRNLMHRLQQGAKVSSKFESYVKNNVMLKVEHLLGITQTVTEFGIMIKETTFTWKY